MKSVLILGANGHLGLNLTQLLVEKGYRVRATVRDLRDERKTAHLRKLDAELAEADITNPESLRNAMKNIDGVFHLAAVYDVTPKNPEKDVREPTVSGIQNVLQAAKVAGVKKIVATSSIVAVGTVAPGEEPLTEKNWNDRAIEPYAMAKTEAERLSWDYAKKNGLSLVSILPATMIGPGFYRHTPSTLGFELLLKGQIPFALPMIFDFVDVRDVAVAHLASFENENASGRYIASNVPLSFMELFQKIKKFDPKIKIPDKILPNAMLGLVPFLDWLGHTISKTPRFASRALIREYGMREQRVSNARIKKELRWEPRAIDQSISDTVEWVRAHYM